MCAHKNICVEQEYCRKSFVRVFLSRNVQWSCCLPRKWKRHEIERKKAWYLLTCTLTWQWWYTGIHRLMELLHCVLMSVIEWQRKVKPETPDEEGRVTVTLVAVTVWFSISVLSFNKTGLAGREQRKKKRDRQWFQASLTFFLFTREQERKTDQCGEKWRWENRERRRVQLHQKRNYVWQGNWRKRKRNGWRREKTPTHRDWKQVGGGVASQRRCKWVRLGRGVLPCSRVVVGGEMCREPIVLTELQVILLMWSDQGRTSGATKTQTTAMVLLRSHWHFSTVQT